MAISACFGGPLLNILLGVGLSGSYYINASGHPYPIKFDPTLLATCMALIAVLGMLLLLTRTVSDGLSSRKLHLCSDEWVYDDKKVGSMYVYSDSLIRN